MLVCPKKSSTKEYVSCFLPDLGTVKSLGNPPYSGENSGADGSICPQPQLNAVPSAANADVASVPLRKRGDRELSCQFLNIADLGVLFCQHCSFPHK